MNDLVERLRVQARPKGMEHRDVSDVLMQEAADEIEQLRGRCAGLEAALEIAVSRLEEEES